jgi:dipeptidyl aminopeptidase/acylaminoacyl peptidase
LKPEAASTVTLQPGQTLSHYRLVEKIGEGGMGVVWKAEDTKLGRHVALKVLPAHLADSPDRRRRFETEARAAGQLNHPNVLAVYDVGAHEGAPYVVTELLEGETLRERMVGSALSPRRAIDYAVQIAQGLAAAHDKGIVHRDLKPDNIFITKEGRLEILDFGLAKLTGPAEIPEEASAAPTQMEETAPGVVIGTIAYMSPEQARGKPADHRSDIFNLGIILYEMLSGRRPFKGESSVDTLMAIAKEDPPDLSQVRPGIPPGLERVVHHCLEKNPEERFQSTRDLAFDLEALQGSGSGAARAVAGPAPRPRLLLGIAAAAALLALAAGILLGRRSAPAIPDPHYNQLTYRQGTVHSARFAPDGQTIVYSAAWEGQPSQIYTTRPEGRGSRSLGMEGAEILSISSSGEMAILLDRMTLIGWMSRGRLALAPLAGGAPREIRDNVQDADWSPDGSVLAATVSVESGFQLECPLGTVLYKTSGYLSHPRLSPSGDRIAFFDHPVAGDNVGRVSVVDLEGAKRDLTPVYNSTRGIAWRPDGREIWFSAVVEHSNGQIFAVDLDGNLRAVARAPVNVSVQDISSDGRVLATQELLRRGMAALPPGETEERDLSWLDWSWVTDITPDGRTVLFSEQGVGGGPEYSVYIRGTGGTPAVRLGEGNAMAFSPEGDWVLAVGVERPDRLHLLPTGAGQARLVTEGGPLIWGAEWLPGGRRIVALAAGEDEELRIHLIDPESGSVRPLSEEVVAPARFFGTPDGKAVAALGPDRRLRLYRVDGGGSVPVPGAEEGEGPVAWLDGGRTLLVNRVGDTPARVFRIEMATGARMIWRDLAPADPAGLLDVGPIHVTPDGGSYVYSYRRWLSTLYLVEGLVPEEAL